MEHKYFKIRNPETGIWIQEYGDTYNKLIDSGKYTETQLLRQPKWAIKKPKNSKVLRGYVNQYKNEQRLKTIVIPEEIIVEEIFMKVDNSYFVPIWLVSKKFNTYMNDKGFWEKMYNKYYGNSEMKARLPNLTFLEVFKICFNLKFIQVTFGIQNPITLLNLYNSTMLNIHGGMSRKFLYALQFMHNVTTINFHPKLFGYNCIPHELDKMPQLKNVNYVKQ